MSDYAELRRLAEASKCGFSGEWYRVEDIDGLHFDDFIAAASPKVVLGLLARIEELEADNRACVEAVVECGKKAGQLQAEVDGLSNAAMVAEDYAHKWGEERDEARDAVKRLAVALEEFIPSIDGHGGPWPMWVRIFREALADPVVKAIVEGV